jgi:NADPH2:quinone reductase
LALITAWEALIKRGNLKEGQTALIHAGAGGVGHIAIQLARYLKARVATTISGEEKAAFAQSLGAELAIDYRRHDFVDTALDWTEELGVNLALDTVGGETFCKSFSAIQLYGRIVSLL